MQPASKLASNTVKVDNTVVTVFNPDCSMNVVCLNCGGVVKKRCACTEAYKKCFCLAAFQRPFCVKEWDEII